jgi:hypothetical protein
MAHGREKQGNARDVFKERWVRRAALRQKKQW